MRIFSFRNICTAIIFVVTVIFIFKYIIMGIGKGIEMASLSINILYPTTYCIFRKIITPAKDIKNVFDNAYSGFYNTVINIFITVIVLFGCFYVVYFLGNYVIQLLKKNNIIVCFESNVYNFGIASASAAVSYFLLAFILYEIQKIRQNLHK